MNQLLDLQTIAEVLGAVKEVAYGKTRLPFPPVSILDFQENQGVRGPAACPVPRKLAGPCSRQRGRQVERERVQTSHAWPKDSNAGRQTFHLTSPADRAWLCAWCLRVIMIKNSRH